MSLLTSLANASLVGGAASSGATAPVLSASRPIVEEGDEVQFILSVPDGVEGTTYPYTITGISQSDLFYGTLTGNFTLDNLQGAQVSIILATDSVTEIETITMTVSSLDLSVQVAITDTSPAPVGEITYDIPGTYQWVCPAGVTSVSVVAIGGGGGGTTWYGSSQSGTGGGGGGLGYKNNIAVTPGNSYNVTVGAGGATYSGNGGTSFFISTIIVRGSGGAGGINHYGTGDVSGGAGGTYLGDGGGNGGTGIVMDVTYKNGQCGGGSGAGGYGYVGGYGGGSTTTVSDFSKRAGGNGTYSGAGGGIFIGSASSIGSAGAGGGTGVYGREPGYVTTTGGAYNVSYSGGDGQQYGPQLWTSLKDGGNQTIVSNAQKYGGGGPARNDNGACRGSSGAVRIMWGEGRSFPNSAGYAAPSSGTSVTLHQTLNNPNAYDTSVSDQFGYSVAIDGNYAIVGAYTEDDAGGTSSGKAYIFNVTTGALVHTLDNPNAYDTSTDDNFGWSVGISGNYAIVGAYGEDDADGTQSGKAYIFNVTTGDLVHTLDNPNAFGTSDTDRFGVSVSISGNYAIVGARWDADADGTGSGKAYIFNVTTGALLNTLVNPNAYGTSDSDNFGFAVSISGDYAIVGAYAEDEASGLNSGKAYIFNVTTGALLHTLDNPNAYNTVATDHFGYRVSISGNYAIVCAWREDEATGTDSGKAYIYNVTTGDLVHTLNNPNAYDTPQSDYFGNSVSISGNYAIVGAQYEDEAGSTSSGKAYIFNVTTGALVHTLDNPNPIGTSTNDYFGYSVGISGNYAVVSAYLEDDADGTDSGKAYIYRLTQD